MVYRLPGSSVHGVLQARILEWVAISSSRGSSQPRDRTHAPVLPPHPSTPQRGLGASTSGATRGARGPNAPPSSSDRLSPPGDADGGRLLHNRRAPPELPSAATFARQKKRPTWEKAPRAHLGAALPRPRRGSPSRQPPCWAPRSIVWRVCARCVPGRGRRLLPGPGGRVAAAKSLQSCPTLRNPIDSSPPGSPAPRILQARTLEWVAISFSSETVSDSLPATPKSPPTRRVPPRGHSR